MRRSIAALASARAGVCACLRMGHIACARLGLKLLETAAEEHFDPCALPSVAVCSTALPSFMIRAASCAGRVAVHDLSRCEGLRIGSARSVDVQSALHACAWHSASCLVPHAHTLPTVRCAAGVARSGIGWRAGWRVGPRSSAKCLPCKICCAAIRFSSSRLGVCAENASERRRVRPSD